MSRNHARIVVGNGRATIEDLGSKNGTFLRGERLQAPQTLRDSDEIRLGRIRLTFKMPGGVASTHTEASEP